MSITPTILCQGQIDASNRSGYRLGLPFRAGGFEGGSRSAYHVFVHTVGKTHPGRRAETAPRHPKYEVFFERGCEARVINAARRSTEDIERPLRFPAPIATKPARFSRIQSRRPIPQTPPETPSFRSCTISSRQDALRHPPAALAGLGLPHAGAEAGGVLTYLYRFTGLYQNVQPLLPGVFTHIIRRYHSGYSPRKFTLITYESRYMD